MTHARLSPSGASRWMNCPGSVAAEAPYPDDASFYAAEGTVAHDVAARCLEEGDDPFLSVGATYHLGKSGDIIPSNSNAEVVFEIEVDRDMAHFVQKYIAQVWAENVTADHYQVETAVPIDHITGEDGATGTADFVGVEFKTNVTVVRLHDLKYGQGVPVEAEGNLQLVMYASGVLRELAWLLDGDLDCDVWLELHIHQVRLDYHSVWYLTLDELREYEELLRAGAARCTDDAPRIPGEKQCRFCKHRVACPELQQAIFAHVGQEPPQDAEHVAVAMPLLKMIRDWCATVEARAIELCEANDPTICQHYKMVEGRRSRAWSANPDTVERRLKYKTGLKQDDIYTRQLISPAQAEKLVPKDQWPRIEKVIEVRPGKPTIAPITDKRPAVNGAEAMGFADLSGEAA